MKKFKILIVEDEEMLLDLFEMLISGEIKCEITTACDGLQAMKVLEADHDFQLVISDYRMPKCSGGDLYKHMKDRYNIPFYLFSGGELEDYSEFNDFKTNNPDNRFFNKPFNEKELIREIKLLFEKTL